MALLVRFICVNFNKINNFSFTQLKAFQNEQEMRFINVNTRFPCETLFVPILMNESLSLMYLDEWASLINII